MKAYYNDVDPFVCQWVRNLIKAGLITPGDVDERPIEDVQATDLGGYDRCHFFCGIAIWDHALNQSGWGDSPVWTGSCPCQPFSCAGKQLGTADKRHLWPAWFRLIRECRPEQLFGEQVAGPAALAWLDLVSADLEDAGYAVGAADLCAAGCGAPHIRQRLYWMAHAANDGQLGPTIKGSASTPASAGRSEWNAQEHDRESARRCDADRLADSTPGGQRIDGGTPGDARHAPQCEPVGGMEHAASEQVGIPGRAREPRSSGFWTDAAWLPCSDGKARPVEPGTFPLAHGIAGRVGKLRAYGNALCAPVAQAFVEAVMGCV